MKFALWLKQEGEGCDYMIGCGATLINFASESLETAREEAKRAIEEHTYVSDFDNRTFKQALLVQIAEDLTPHCQVAVKKKFAEQAEEKTQAKREQLERLKRELGE